MAKAKKAGPFIQTKRAKKTPGKTVKVGGTVVIKKKGEKPLAFKKGGLHVSTGTPQGEKIPKSKINAALKGDYGHRAKMQAMFYENVLKP